MLYTVMSPWTHFSAATPIWSYVDYNAVKIPTKIIAIFHCTTLALANMKSQEKRLSIGQLSWVEFCGRSRENSEKFAHCATGTVQNVTEQNMTTTIQASSERSHIHE